MTRYLTVEGAAREAHVQEMRGLGEGTTYPLGEDRFSIDRGEDFFAFVDRLGPTGYDLAFDDEGLVAMAAAVLIDRPVSGKEAPCWYLCDLKVSARSRNPLMSLRLFARGIEQRRARSEMTYMISMDPSTGPNRVARMLERLGDLELKAGPKLHLFSLSADEMLGTRALLEAHRGPLWFKRLEGVKEIVLQSTGEPIPLWHVQWANAPEGERTEPATGGVHMFCVPEDDPLFDLLCERRFVPGARASVLHRGMEQMDWSRILTSEI